MDSYLMRLFAPAMILYVALVVLVNIGFSHVPMFSTPIGLVSPMATVVGAIFVVRDFAQRRSGHFVLFAMLAAIALSYLLADPAIAVASALAFTASEVIDWLVYTVTKRPFRERVLISSLVSAPVDTAVFLFGISGFTIGTFLLMVASKLIAAAVIWFLYRQDVVAEPVNLRRSGREDKFVSSGDHRTWEDVDRRSGRGVHAPQTVFGKRDWPAPHSR